MFGVLLFSLGAGKLTAIKPHRNPQRCWKSPPRCQARPGKCARLQAAHTYRELTEKSKARWRKTVAVLVEQTTDSTRVAP